MQNVLDETFVDQRIDLNEKIFQNCNFIKCTLVIDTENFRCNNCDFEDCKLFINKKCNCDIGYLKSFKIEFEDKIKRNNILNGIIIECGNSKSWKAISVFDKVPPDKKGLFTFTSVRPNTEVIGKIRQAGNTNSEINFNTKKNSNSNFSIPLPSIGGIIEYKIISGSCGIIIRINGFEI